MTRGSHLSEMLWSLMSSLRSPAETSVLLDVIRCLLLLRYVEIVSLRSGQQEKALAVPEQARWSHLQSRLQALSEALERASRELERANPQLAGMLTTVDFKQIEPWNAETRDIILRRIINGLSNIVTPEFADRAGEAHEGLLTLFGEHGKSVGESIIPAPLARLMVELLDLQDKSTVCDPVCRAGRTLVECALFAGARGLDVKLHGQDRNQRLCIMSKTNLFLHGRHDVRIEPGDVLRSPMRTDTGELCRYNRVLTAPPINSSNWGAESAHEDPFGRFPIVPPKNSADYAYVLHCLSTLEEGGRAVILTGRGVLFRQGSEEQIRRMLVQRDHFEAIIGLPGGLLYGTHIPAALLILRKGVSPHQGNVLFAELRRSNEQRSREQSLGPEDIQSIASCVREFQTVEGMSSVATLREIEENQWILNPDRYIPRKPVHANIDVDERLSTIRHLEEERDEALARVDALIEELRGTLGL